MRRCPNRLGRLWQRRRKRDWWSIDLEGEVEKLEVRGLWSVTEGDSVNPDGEVSHRSDRTKAAKEEKETLKEDEMGVDADAPRGESADTKKHAKEGDSGRIRRSPRLPLWDAGNQPGRSRGIDFCAPSAFSHEDPFISATTVAVKKAIRYWQFASVVVEEGGEARTQLICVSSDTTCGWCSKVSRG